MRQGWSLFIGQSTPRPRFEIFSGGTGATADSNVDIDDGNWHHIVGVKTGTNIKIYVDGVLRGTTTHSLGSTDKAIPLSLGNRPSSSDRAFAGGLDEVRIYNRALASGEVASMFWNAQRVYVNGGYEVDTVSGEETISYFHGSQLVAVKKGTTLEYIHPDHLGSSSVTADSTGASPAHVAYLPYGADRSAAGVLPTERRYTGQRFDNANDLYFYNARYYDAGLGRFISADAVVPGAGNPQAWNRYAYVFNNPVRYTDETGNCPWCIGAAIGARSYTVTHVAATITRTPGNEGLRGVICRSAETVRIRDLAEATVIGAATGGLSSTGTIAGAAIARATGSRLVHTTVVGALGSSTQYGVDVVEGQDTLSVEDAFANIGPGIMAGGLDSASNVLPRAVSAVAGVTGALSLDSTLTVLDGLSYESPYPTPTPVIEPVRFAPYLFSGPSNFIYENESFY